MNVRQEGLGICQKCGTPVMQAVNQPGVAGLCFGCSADAEPKTGRTVIVHESKEEKAQTGHATLSPTISSIEVVEHTVGEASALPKDPNAIRKAIQGKQKGVSGGVSTVAEIPTSDFAYNIPFNLEELEQGDCLVVLLKRLYDALDNSSFTTIKDAKRVMSLQDAIQKKIDKLRSK